MELTTNARKAMLGLLVLTALLLVVEPGRVPLFEPDEGRYAEIPREMLSTGDWVTPRLNGVLYFEKPPLHYWSVATSFLLFGETELASRIPTKLASLAMVVLTYLFARRRYGRDVGLLAALIVGSSGLLFALARITIIDPSLSCALSAAVFAFVAFQEAEAEGDRKRAQRALYGLHVACAAAVLLKGLIGIVLPGGAIVFWMLVTGRWRVLPRLFSPGPLLVFLALSVPWHVVVARRNPGWFDFYIINEHFNRFAKSGHRREGSPLYFVAVLLGGFLPWTAFFGRFRESWPGRRLAAWRERPGEAFLWIWALLVFVFFSVSKSKLIPYLEPIWPALAVLLAVGIERAAGKGATFDVDRRILGALFVLLFGTGLYYGFGEGYVKELSLGGAAVPILAGLLGGAVRNLIGRRTADLPGPEVAVPWLIFLAGAVMALPAVARSITPWPLVSVMMRELKPDDVLVQRGHYLEAAPFYAKRVTPISRLGWSELDFGRANPHAPGLFPTDEEFKALWNGPRRVLAIVHRDNLRDFTDEGSGLRKAVILSKTQNDKDYLLVPAP